MRSVKLLAALVVLVIPLGSPQTLHAQDQPAYVRITPADLKWSPLASMPKGAQIAVLHGSLAKPGLFTIRVKLPANFKLPVHSHPDERVRTIISGTYYSGIGDKAESSRLMALPPGHVLACPTQGVAIRRNTRRRGHLPDHRRRPLRYRLPECNRRSAEGSIGVRHCGKRRATRTSPKLARTRPNSPPEVRAIPARGRPGSECRAPTRSRQCRLRRPARSSRYGRAPSCQSCRSSRSSRW